MTADEPGEVLLTGATGFVGMELLGRYLENDGRQVVVLVRAQDDDAAEARLESVLVNLYGDRAGLMAGRVRALAADLTVPGLGLSPRVREHLASGVSTIVHCAASVSFTLALDRARAINLEGTRRMLELAREASARGGLRRYAHVSTAYVAGTHSGAFAERDLDLGQAWHNSYEQTKFEAEQLVRTSTDLPFTILRPSIVVGERSSGWTSAFNVLYSPLQAIAHGMLPAVPAIPTAPLDVVSVDFVADAVHAVCESDGGIGETFHLTAGPGASTVGEVAQQAADYFCQPAPVQVPPDQFAALSSSPARAAARGAADPGQYFPYMSLSAVFDQTWTSERLEPYGIRPTPLTDYLDRLLDFATRTGWGKRPICRADAGGALSSSPPRRG